MNDEYITGLTGWFQGEAHICAENSSLLEVAGTYCIYTQRFTPENSLAFDEIFAQLPSLRSGADEPPCFYGADETAPQFLTWSNEPSGIVVWGKLMPEQWQEWDEAFRRLVDLAALPRFHE